MDARLIAAAVPVFFAAIGLELWLTRKRSERFYALHDAVAALSCGVGQQVVLVFLQAVVVAGYAIVYDRFRLFDVSPRSPLAWAALLLLVDVAFYAFHRASHRVNFLWAVHAVHHQSEEYNLAVALRQAWLEPLCQVPFHAPIALLGFPTWMFLLAITINTLYQFWVHTRGIGKLGVVEWLLNTPSHHRVHHAVNPAYVDKNYSGMFIVWDRLFGTFTAEREEPVYGTVKPLHSFNPLWANVAYWVEIGRLASRCRRWRDKVRVPFAPPEWRPRELGGPVVIPDVSRASQVRYDVRAPRAADAYDVVAFAMVVLAATGLMLAQGVWAWPELLVASVVIVWTLITLNGITEARRWALGAEVARLAVLPAAAWLVARGTPWMIPSVALAAVVSAASLAWLLRRVRPVVRAS